MYDFYLGTADEIAANEGKFLLTIKRMLPRWCNSIPDSEYLAIFDILQTRVTRSKPVLVETGVGASTIVLLYHALKHGGLLFSWDLTGPKGAYLRAVCNDTLLQHFRVNLFDHWKFISYNSLSPHLGLAILAGLVDRVDMCFLDSEHTLDVLLGELRIVNRLLTDNSVVAIDDGNYDYRHTNFAYVNIFRKKLGLPLLDSPTENRCRPFHVEVEEYLNSTWGSVCHIPDSYKVSYKDDLFWAYYRSDRKAMAETGMERLADLEHRFDAWQVESRIDHA